MRRRNSIGALLAALLAVAAITIWSAASTVSAQTTCSTNFCVRSQAAAVQVPPGWPAVSVDSCCRTRWGALPDGMDWGTPALSPKGRGSPAVLVARYVSNSSKHALIWM